MTKKPRLPDVRSCLLSAGLLLAAALPTPAAETATDTPRGIILIGWDGTDRQTLLELRSKGLLPNIDKLVSSGSLVATEIATAATETKPGWVEILTGENAVRLGIPTNEDYQPVPKGRTIFERLKSLFTPDGIKTVMLGGKGYNIGVRGPHQICINALHREPATHKYTYYLDRKRFTGLTKSDEPPRWVDRAGEPYFNAQASIDTLALGLGPGVGLRALQEIPGLRGKRFFAFFHFAEPDETGHLFGKASPDYREAIMLADFWLGRILARLEALGMMETTLIYVTADHGFDDQGFQHNKAPRTFVATNSRRRLKDGDRKDVTPTLMQEFGFSPDDLRPGMDGHPLHEDYQSPAPEPLKIGYFIGGRTNIFMRMQEDGDMRRAGLNALLYVKDLRGTKYSPANEKTIDMKSPSYPARATGPELLQGLKDGSWDLATIGESSFLAAVRDGQPVTAVARLGFDIKEKSGHLFALREGVHISTPSDFRGKLLVSRRAGPGDATFLLEYLAQDGVDIKRDVLTLERLPSSQEEKARLPKDKVLVVHKVLDDDLDDIVAKGLIDGGYFHLRPFHHMKGLRPVRALHTIVNPELSCALLVGRSDFLKESRHRERVKDLLRAFMARVRREQALPPKRRIGHHSWRSMDSPSEKMNYPQYDPVPVVKTDLLYDMLALLRKHDAGPWSEILLEPAIDNSLVLEVAEEFPPTAEPPAKKAP